MKVDASISNSLSVQTPLGILSMSFANEHLVAATFTNISESDTNTFLTPLMSEAAKQINAYFKGGLNDFDLPIQTHGTVFQQDVWKKLSTIPYGETISYLELANMVGGPTYTRAVGTANGNNPIVIIIPCHRVIGTNGSLVGYSGGLDRKRRLLSFEKSYKYGTMELFGPDF